MPNIQVGRSDEAEHCVSASSHHLNERAEERKEERGQQVAESTPVTVTQPTQPAAPAPAPAAAAPAAAAAVETGEKEDGVKMEKQASLIQAERTDDATWDANKTESGRGWCCWR